MNAVLKIFLSMSCSGGLLILVLLLGKRFLKDKISRQWQYYIWLVVILRLLLPFGAEVNLLGNTYQAFDHAIPQAALSLSQQPMPRDPETVPSARVNQVNEIESIPTGDFSAVHPLQEIQTLLLQHVWLVWLAVALGLLIRKLTIYQGFMQFVKAGATPVSDVELLDRLSITAGQAGIQNPVELYINPLISSPLLIGFFHPCIVLPSADFPEADFPYIVLHELTHYKRRDLFYKWLVQITVCLHWFNPLVHVMSREITNACEFSCDEAVLSKMGDGHAQKYGKTLLDAMAAVGRYKENLGAVTLSENKSLLKERLGAIMSFKGKSKTVRLLTGLLTLCVILSAFFVGVYSAAVSAPHSLTGNSLTTDGFSAMETQEVDGTTYYLVQNEAQLRAIGTGEYGMDQDYMQQADIRLSAAEWMPIGTRDNPFTGTFNGNGFEIIGLTMTDPYADLAGLFGAAKNAHIYNITMRDVDIESAGRAAETTSVGAVVAFGGGAYDCTVFPKSADKNEQQDSSRQEMDLQQERLNSSYEQWYTASAPAEQYYEADSLPLFEAAFSRLDEPAQQAWLETLYDNDDAAFFSVAVRSLGRDSLLPASYAEKAYADDNIVLFSVLADYMGEDNLDLWLDKALEDEKRDFQFLLFDKLNRDDEFDESEEKQEKEWAEAQAAEYRAAGITMEGKDYYYQGHLINIFLDLRANSSFYTLNMNPEGTVNIKITRDKNNDITGISYMTWAEAAELLGDMDDDEV